MGKTAEIIEAVSVTSVWENKEKLIFNSINRGYKTHTAVNTDQQSMENTSSLGNFNLLRLLS